MKPNPLRTLLAIACLAALGMPVHADTLSVSTGNDYAPFADKNLPEGGMTAEIVKRAFAVMGDTADVVFVDWSKAYDDAKTGKYNATFPWFESAERQAAFNYSEPIFTLTQRAFMRADHKFSVGNSSALKGKTVCIPKGWTVLPFIAPLIKNGTVKQVEAPDITPCAKMVGEGKADFYLTDEIQGRQAYRSAGYTDKDMVASPEGLADSGLFLLTSKSAANGAEIIKKFNAGLRKLKETGEYGKIVKKHLSQATKG